MADILQIFSYIPMNEKYCILAPGRLEYNYRQATGLDA